MDTSWLLGEQQTDAHYSLRTRIPGRETISAFGPEAQRWAARLHSSGTQVVVADTSASSRALEEATLRRRAAYLLTAPVLDESRAVVARRLAPLIHEHACDNNLRRTMFDALSAGTLVLDAMTQKSLLAVDERVRQTLRDLYLVGCATLVRSRRQAAFLSEFFGRYRPSYVVRPGIDGEVPLPEALDHGNSIVIWAPQQDVAALSILLFALADLRAPIVVIGLRSAGAFANVRVASLAEASAELCHAALIVDASLSDPASTVALAAWRLPIVAASSSGADEFVEGIRLYDPWSWRSVIAAVSAARADAPPGLLTDVRTASVVTPATAVPALRDADPLVTIIVPTYDRAAVLPLALDSVQAQSYPNIEIIVVNDGGRPIDELVARYPRARCISNAKNCGVLTSCNIGIANARGNYIGFLSDDDIYYFDHVERLVNALEQSHAHVAHANSVTRFLEIDADGVLQTSGNHVLFATYLDMTEALWWGYLGCNLVRRDVFAQIGGYDITNAVADYEMFIRLSRSFDFIHVDQVTFEWRYRTDRATLTHNVGNAAIIDGLVRIFDRYPSNGDPRVEQGRAATLAFIRDHSDMPYWEPPLRLARP